MPRWLSLSLLVASPLAITAGLVLLGLFLHALSGVWGPRKSPAPIVGVLVGVALLHGGYYLGPWLFLWQRNALALWLMVPIALAAFMVGLVVASRLASASAGDEGTSMAQLSRAAALFGGAIAYGGPIAIMIFSREE